MSFVTRAWEIRKTHGNSQTLPSYQYRGLSCIIVHDHSTEGHQKTMLFFAGKTSEQQLNSKAKSFVSDIGYNLRSDVPIFGNRPPIPHAKFWAVGKPRIKRFANFSMTEEEEDSAPEIEIVKEPEAEKQLAHRLFFPEAGSGVVIAAVPGHKNWHVKVWAYGDERLEVINKADDYARILSGAERAVSKTGSGLAKLLFAGASVFCATWLFGWMGVLQPGVANASLFAGLISAGAGLCAWWRNPMRKSWLSRGIPKSVVKAAKPIKKSLRSENTIRGGIEFELPPEADLSLCVDVPANHSILPDLGGVDVGSDGTGRVVRIPDSDRYMGITAVGAPGTGKTTMMLRVAGGDIMRMKAGEDHTLVWFETKKDGAARLMDIARKAGVEPLYFVPGSPTGPQLRWLDWEDPHADSGTMTEAFVSSFEPTSIMEQSRDVLVGLIDMASLVWWDHLSAIGETKMNLMRTAWILSGGLPDRWKKADALVEQLSKSTPDQQRFNKCKERLGSFMSSSDTRRDAVMSPARNKLNRLKDCPAWDIDLRRPAMTWKEVMESRRPVIVDISKFDDPTLVGYSDELIRILLPTALYTFWSQAQFFCHDWYEKGRSVALYCDEASNLPWQSGHILSAIAAKGRSHGVSLVLGAQNWHQLSDITQIAFKTLGHKFFFSQNDDDSATALASAFDTDSSYTKETLKNLTPFETLAVVKIGKTLHQPTLLNIANDSDWKPENSWTGTVPVAA